MLRRFPPRQALKLIDFLLSFDIFYNLKRGGNPAAFYNPYIFLYFILLKVQKSLQLCGLVGFFPRHAEILPPDVAVSSQRPIDRTAQV